MAAKDQQDQQDSPIDKATNTKGETFDQAAQTADPAEVGYIGTSPERERTGLADKGLSQQTDAVMKGGPVPDARPGVDDSAALKG